MICIDFEPGIPGREIARRVARRLGLPLIDREIVSRAAHALRLPEAEVEALDGEPDHPIERWILAAAEGDQAIGLTGRTTPQSDPLIHPRRLLMNAMRMAIVELSSRPGVIAGHEAAYVLESAGLDVIRILLRADETRRQRWLVERLLPSAHGRLRRISELDTAKRIYIRQMFGSVWPDPARYELSFDVGQVGMDGAIEMAVAFVRCGQALMTPRHETTQRAAVHGRLNVLVTILKPGGSRGCCTW